MKKTATSYVFGIAALTTCPKGVVPTEKEVDTAIRSSTSTVQSTEEINSATIEGPDQKLNANRLCQETTLVSSCHTVVTDLNILLIHVLPEVNKLSIDMGIKPIATEVVK